MVIVVRPGPGHLEAHALVQVQGCLVALPHLQDHFQGWRAQAAQATWISNEVAIPINNVHFALVACIMSWWPSKLVAAQMAACDLVQMHPRCLAPINGGCALFNLVSFQNQNKPS